MKANEITGSESFWRRNPHLCSVGSVETKVAQPTSAQTLVGQCSKLKAGKAGLGVRVVFIVACKRRLDDDNLQGSLKPLRDAIADSLQLDDGDRRITWEYNQVHTRYDEGVFVKIKA